MIKYLLLLSVPLKTPSLLYHPLTLALTLALSNNH